MTPPSDLAPGPRDRPRKARALALALAALAAVGVLLLAPLPHAWQSGWRARLLDFGHVPLFAALTVALWPALRGPWYRPVLAAVAVAALGEVLQGFVDRTPDWADLLHGALGALSAGVALRGWEGPRTAARLALHAAAALGVLAWPVAEYGPGLLDAYEAHSDFPTLADFSTARQSVRWHCRQATLQRVPCPGRPGGWAGRLEFLPGPAKYPGASLEPAVGDWTGYRRLCWSLTVEEGPLVLAFSVRAGSRHYDTQRTFGPGRHTPAVELAVAAARAEGGPLDLARVTGALVFVIRPASPRVVTLHRVWLE
jgi:hypothetical protein